MGCLMLPVGFPGNQWICLTFAILRQPGPYGGTLGFASRPLTPGGRLPLEGPCCVAAQRFLPIDGDFGDGLLLG